MLPNINKKKLAVWPTSSLPPSHLFLDRTKQIHPDYKQWELALLNWESFVLQGNELSMCCQEIKQWNITVRGVNFRHEVPLFYQFLQGSPPGIHKAVLRLFLIIHRYWNSKQLLFCWSVIHKYLLNGGTARAGWRIRVSQVSHPGAVTQRFGHFPVILIILGAFYPTSENGFCINLVAFANKYKIFYDSKTPCSKGRGLGMLFCCSDYSEISETSHPV